MADVILRSVPVKEVVQETRRAMPRLDYTRTKLLEPMSFALLVGLLGGIQGSLSVLAPTLKGNDT